MTSLQSTLLRSCVGCRKRENPIALLRTVFRDGKIFPDPDRSSPGRGAWIHLECAKRATERGAFNRALRQDCKLDESDLLDFIKNKMMQDKSINELDAKDMKLK